MIEEEIDIRMLRVLISFEFLTFGFRSVLTVISKQCKPRNEVNEGNYTRRTDLKGGGNKDGEELSFYARL